MKLWCYTPHHTEGKVSTVHVWLWFYGAEAVKLLLAYPCKQKTSDLHWLSIHHYEIAKVVKQHKTDLNHVLATCMFSFLLVSYKECTTRIIASRTIPSK